MQLMVYTLFVNSTEHWLFLPVSRQEERKITETVCSSLQNENMQGFLATCKTSSMTLGLVESCDLANLNETRDGLQGYDSDGDKAIDSVLPM